MWRTTRPGRVPPNLAGFQSTSSVWRTTTGKDGETRKANISIHVLRVEDDQVHARKVHRQGISIHVLRVEDD